MPILFDFTYDSEGNYHYFDGTHNVQGSRKMNTTEKTPAVKTITNIERHISAYFPLDTVTVELGEDTTYLVINTRLDADEAMKRLDLFDEEWWLDHRVNKICVTVDYPTTKHNKIHLPTEKRGTIADVALQLAS